MRAVSSSLMAALVVVALFWGNCFSCPQMLLAWVNHHGAHSCCHHKQPAKVECQSQAVRNFVKANAGAHTPDLAVAIRPVAPDVTAAAPAAVVIPAEEYAPDLLCLHSSFRI